MIDVKEMLNRMVKEDGSDIFLAVGAPPVMSVRDKLVTLSSDRLKPADTDQIANELMADRFQETFKSDLEVDLAYSVHGVGRFRLNVFRQRGTVGLVIRRIKLDVMSIDDLKLPEILKTVALEERGLVLVTGATGSGKSTTLASMIDYRNRNKPGHIVTIEDPMEFIHNHKKSIVTQREVGTDTQTYARALKSALRQAPDVMLIGEIRDRETMQAALNFAETGHLVFSTLHANNASQTLERVLNIFPNDMHQMIHMQLSLNLKAVICQRLVPKINNEGRAAALEIMLSTPRVADLIHRGETHSLRPVIAAGTREGMQTFDQNLFRLYTDGAIDYDTAIRSADSANDLKLRIRTEMPDGILNPAAATEN
jgi:twitching motility protein PilU